MFARRMRNLKESGILTFSKKARELQAKGADIIRLDMGNVSLNTPQEVGKWATEALEEGHTRYEGVSTGFPELRQAICDHYWKSYGVKFEPEEVAVTPGAMAATYTTFTLLCDEGDEVILTDPAWEVYESQISTTLAKPRKVSLEENEGWRLKPGALSTVTNPNTKLLVLNSPNNPTGSLLGEGEFDEIVSACSGHDFKILWDEPYKDTVYEGKHHTLAEYEELGDRIITAGSLSKSHAMTGWRVGYLISREREFMRKVESIARINWTCLPPFIQKAATRIFQDPSVSGGREALLDEYRRRRDLTMKILGDGDIPCVKPKGAIYTFPNIGKTGLDSFAASDALLTKEGVAVVPGGYFGERGLKNVRICFTAPTSEEALSEGLNRFVTGVSGMVSQKLPLKTTL
jgi:aspartate/methionine/tyrosine aminotransferase